MIGIPYLIEPMKGQSVPKDLYVPLVAVNSKTIGKCSVEAVLLGVARDAAALVCTVGCLGRRRPTGASAAAEWRPASGRRWPVA